MGRIRKALSFAQQNVLPVQVIQYESEAERARMEQTGLLREQTELMRAQMHGTDRLTADDYEWPSHTLVWVCGECISRNCHADADVNVVNDPKLCDCQAHHT